MISRITALSKMLAPTFQIAGLVTASCLLLASSRCAHDYNPFADSTNAQAVLLSTSQIALWSDSIPIHSTRMLGIALLNASLITAVHITTPGTIQEPEQRFEPPFDPTYHIPLTWADTGRFVIRIITRRKGDDQIETTLPLTVYSPLAQRSLDTSTDIEVTLATSPVEDSVWYHWSWSGPFADTIHSRFNLYTTLFEAPGEFTGSLWVSLDSAGLFHPSPKASFRLNLSDYTGPHISLPVNDRLSDTLRLPKAQAAFEVFVTDAAGVLRVTLNSVPMEFIGPPRYATTVRGLDNYSRSAPYTAVVQATDRAGNMSNRTFYLYYDPTATGPSTTTVTLFPDRDSLVSAKAQYLLIGQVSDLTRSVLSVNVATHQAPPLASQQVFLNGTSGWFFLSVPLAPGYNPLTITAADTSGTPLAQCSVVVERSAGTRDTEPPSLYLTLNGLPVENNQTIFSSDSQPLLVIYASDLSGIATMEVNSQAPDERSTPAYRWSTPAGPLAADSLATINVAATDSAGNTTLVRFRAGYNIKPSFSPERNWPTRFFAHTSLSIPFTIRDNNQVQVRLVNAPTSLSVKPATLHNEWLFEIAPTLSDTGSHDVQVVADDGYDTAQVSWRFTILPDSLSLVRFTTGSGSLPTLLQVGRMVHLDLTVADSSGTPPFAWKAFLGESSSPLLETQTQARSARLSWVPAFPDSGNHLLRVVVTSGRHDSDTLARVIRVVYTNSHPVRLIRTLWDNATVLAQGFIDMRSDPQQTTVDYRITDNDEPLTEQYWASTWTSSAGVELAIDSTRSFSLTLPAASSRERDTVMVSVSDRTGISALDTLKLLYSGALP